MLPTFCRAPGGGYKVVYEYANQFVNRGHHVNVIHVRKLPNIIYKYSNRYTFSRMVYHTIRDYISVPKKHWMHIDPLVHMVYLKNYHPRYIPEADAIFATYWATAELVMDLPNKNGEKFYLIQSYEDWAGPRERVENTWKFNINKVVIAKWLYRKSRELSIPENEIIFIPNGLNHSAYKNEKPHRKRNIDVIMMYSPVKVKGGADGIKAITAIKNELPSLKARLFGIGNRPSFIPNWIEYTKDPDLMVLVKDIYNEGKIFICPSLLEGWPLPPAEAMACGCAVVSTDNVGSNEYCVHGENALLSPIGKPELLAENVIKLLKDEKLRNKIAENGTKTIKKFTWEISANLLEKYIINKIG